MNIQESIEKKKPEIVLTIKRKTEVLVLADT